MTDWFSPELAPFLSFLSLTGCVASLDYFARRGEHRGLVTAVYVGTALFGAVLLAAGLVALAVGQRWYVVFPLTFVGAVILPACLWGALDLKRAYSTAELRRTVAKDL